MSNLIAKCGIDCSACPWGPYPRKDMTAEEFEQYRINAKKILGYMPIKTPCLTCQTPDPEIPKGMKLPNRKCLVRQCVDKTGITNCAYCSRFPCDTVRETSDAWNREKIEKKLGNPISQEEYHAFVEPFEGISRLKVVRTSLRPEEIVEPARASTLEARIAVFPENLPFSEKEASSFKAVYKLLVAIISSPLGLRDTGTFVQQNKLVNRRAQVLRFLWILGCYGDFDKENGKYVVVEAETYAANRGSEKTLAIWSFVKDVVFMVLSEFGVVSERVALEGVKEKDLTTGTGYLRSKGWFMKMTFEEEIGGVAALKALEIYTEKLKEKYGRKAFKHFSEADMQILASSTM